MHSFLIILASTISSIPSIDACHLEGRTIRSDIKYCGYEDGQYDCKIMRTKWLPLGDKILYYDGIRPDSGWIFYRGRRVDITNDSNQNHPRVPGNRKSREFVESVEVEDTIKLSYLIEVFGRRSTDKLVETGFDQDTRLIDCNSCEIVNYRSWTTGYGRYRNSSSSKEFSSASCIID
jgi:hypothetical protein